MSLRVAREDFPQLEEAWRLLLPSTGANTIFSTFDWQRIWWQHFSKAKDLYLLSVRDGDDLIGIAPLFLEKGVLCLLGGTEVSDYLDFIVAPGQENAVYQAVLDFLGPLPWLSLDLHCLPSQSHTLGRFVELAQARGYQVEQMVENVCPTVDLPATWEEYLSRLSKKDRHELRRKLRRLAKAGESHYYIASAATLLTDMEDFFHFAQDSRMDRAEFMSPPMRAFFREMALAFMKKGQLRLYFLELNGVRVASALCFDQNGQSLLYNSGYDPAYASLSVGLLLKAFCIKDAIEAGKTHFDFLRGNEPYKYDLGGQDVPLYRCVVRRN